MACEDCDRGRRSSEYRRFDLKCLWCGGRYARAVRISEQLKLPAKVADQEMSRRQWFDHVVATWAEFGHDREKLLEIARGAVMPFEPVEHRHADDADTPQDGKRGKRAGALARKAPARQGGARGDRVDAEGQAPAAAAAGGDDDQGGADEWAR